MNKTRCMKCMQTYDEQYDICPHCGYKRGTEPANPLYLPEGTVLEDKYLIGAAIGHGGFGITYIALDRLLDKRVAIKEYFPASLSTRTIGDQIIYPFTTQDADNNYRYGREKFIEEARTLAKFSGMESIVSILTCFTQNNTAYIVMEYLEGEDLLEYVKQRGGKIRWEETLTLLAPVMDALIALHAQGLIHRDISPDNIFVTKGGKTKLLDFGTARFAMGEKSKSLSVILKPGYAPPEQYSSRGKQGPWTDVYALAATIYRCITGQAPADAVDRQMGTDIELPSSLGADIPGEAEDALMRALALELESRLQTVDEFKQELGKKEIRHKTGKPRKTSSIDASALNNTAEKEAEAQEILDSHDLKGIREPKNLNTSPASAKGLGKLKTAMLIAGKTLLSKKALLIAALSVMVLATLCITLNFAYLQPLNQRYDDEIAQLKESIAAYEQSIQAGFSSDDTDIESKIARCSTLMTKSDSFLQALISINENPGYAMVFSKETEETIGIPELRAFADTYQQELDSMEADYQEREKVTAAYEEAIADVLNNLDQLSSENADSSTPLAEQLDYYSTIMTQTGEQIAQLEQINSRPEYSESLYFVTADSPEISRYTKNIVIVESLEAALANSNALEEQIDIFLDGLSDYEFTISLFQYNTGVDPDDPDPSAPEEAVLAWIEMNDAIMQSFSLFLALDIPILTSLKDAAETYLNGLSKRAEYLDEMVEYARDYRESRFALQALVLYDYEIYRSQCRDLRLQYKEHLANAKIIRAEYRELLGFE